MATSQNIQFSSSIDTPAAAKPSALFVQGVPDDGLILVTAKLPSAKAQQQAMRQFERVASGSVLSRHVLGSLTHFEYVSIPGLVNEVLLITGEENQTMRFNVPNVIVNCIADPDVATGALSKLQGIIDRLEAQHKTNIPVINPPAGILRTTREKIYAQFKDLPGLHMPKVIRIAPESVADTVRQIKAAGIVPPFLIRGVGTHGGKSMQRIADWSEAELLKLERYAYDGRDYYVTQWENFQSSDRFWRKSRFVIVGGKCIARHRIISPGWDTHSGSRKTLMEDREDLRREEETFLNQSVEETMSKEAMGSLLAVYKSLGLDYFGVDCHIDDKGNLTVFEINAAFNTMVQANLGVYPYLAPSRQQIITAFNEVVAAKATFARVATIPA